MTVKFLVDRVDDDAAVVQAVRQVVAVSGGGSVTVTFDTATGELSIVGSGAGGGGAAGAFVSYVGDGSGNFDMTDTSYADVGDVQVDIPASDGEKLLITFDGTVAHNTTGEYTGLRFDVGGTPTTAQLNTTPTGGNSFAWTKAMPHVVDSGEIVAGFVTVKLQLVVSAGMATVLNESTLNRRPVLTVTNMG